jgi:chromosome partitioning protein
MTVFAVALSKGGSTKTTTAAELVVALARGGQRVLAVDLDQQGNLTTRLGVTDDTEVAAVAADVLAGTSSAEDAAVDAPAVPGASVLAGTHDLANLAQRPEVIASLRDYLPSVAARWEHVVIDTPPALDLITLTGLAAANVVVAALACETEAYDQLGRLAQVLEERVAPRMRPGQRIHWIVPSRYDSRRRLDRDVLDTLAEEYPGRITSPIREAVAARDAYTSGMPVSLYAPGSGIADDYAAALAPILAAADEKKETRP